MKNSIIVLSTLFAIIGCNKNATFDPLEIKAEINVKNIKYLLENSVSGNEDCNNFFVSLSNSNENNFKYNLLFNLSKNGEINSVTLVDIKDNSKNYKSSTFNPKETFKIKSFSYDSINNNLSYEYEGLVFLPYHKDSILINGYVKNVKINSKECLNVKNELDGSIKFGDGAEANIYTAFSAAVFKSNEYNYSFYTNDGLRFGFNINSPISTLIPGVYNINTSGSLNLTVTFEEYLGVIDKNYYFLYTPKEWRNFKTEGSLEITEQRTSNNTKMTIGRLKLKIYKDNNIFAIIDNGSFFISNNS
ncbi:hypothetical protein [Runella salmonicolor]|uniref:Lipoprotein n=1 Tax=Runella salmonicolor TaxID=2950278 RepID=A0ABT1FY83_9BACT|nr:hypothetical protein [Runella salmonicolor]MCP1386435.1 hypothetical protein [Runella salmonicolor]